MGEREWLRIREQVQRSMGADFDLKSFHTAAREIGPVGLEMLESEVMRALGQPGAN